MVFLFCVVGGFDRAGLVAVRGLAARAAPEVTGD